MNSPGSRNRFPTKSSSTLARIDGSTPSALEYLTQIHRQQQSNSTTPSTSNSNSRDSSSYAESIASTAATWSDDDKADDRSSTSDSSFEQQLLSSDEDPDSVRHEPGWRGLNTAMPPASSISATLPLSETFDSTQDVDFIPFPNDPYSLRHSEYGYDINPAHRTTSIYHPDGLSAIATSEEPGLLVYFATYMSYAMLIVVGHFNDFFGKWLFPADYQHLLSYDVSCPWYLLAVPC
jgi:serine palmitoyltransferase